MFSFFKIFNSKADTDKDKSADSLCGKTMNLNSPEAKALHVFNQKLLVGTKTNGNNTPVRINCKETVTSPGFTFRIAQKAREMRPNPPRNEILNLSTSYTSDMNGSSAINNSTSRDLYDKKRKLMETLDNFGVRKRTRQEIGVDVFANRHRRIINESNPDCLIALNGHSHRITQATSTVMSPKNLNIENKQVKRHGDFGKNICHLQKKPRTRNNEILSTYSSSKFLLTPGQKRSRPIDYEDQSPKRKHCKSCTCCGSTVILDDDINNLNKSDKTTETDSSDDLVTVAASRIFNRSGKTQVVKRICMKTILDQVFDDSDPVPYTSIEKVEEKKKKVISVPHNDKLNKKNDSQFVESTVSVSPTTSSATSVSSLTPSTTPLLQSSTSLPTSLFPSESTPKLNKGSNNNAPPQFNFGSPIASATASIDITNSKLTNEVDGKVADNKTSESTSNNITSVLTTPKNTEQQTQLSQSSETRENDSLNNDKDEKNSSNNDKEKLKFPFSVPLFKLSESNSNNSDNLSKLPTSDSGNELPVVQFAGQNSSKEVTPTLTFDSHIESSSKQPAFTFGVPKNDEKQSSPVIQFGVSKVGDQQSTPILQFGSPKVDDKKSTPVMQFGASKVDDKRATPVMQFGSPKANDKISTSVMQFGASKVDDKKTPVMQFGSSKVDDKKTTPVMQFGSSKVDDKKTSPIMQFGAPKIEDKPSVPVMQFGSSNVDKKSTPIMQFGTSKTSENPNATPSLFLFGNNQKSSENTKPIESVKFQFGSSKPDSSSGVLSSTEPKTVAFGSNNVQNQNLFSFGKTDSSSLATGGLPKYDATNEKSTPKLQFGALPTPLFGTSTDQPKPDNQGSKLVFGNQNENNPLTTSTSNINFSNNATNPVFQFNNSSSKPNDKPSDVSSSTFSFASNKTAPTFGASASQSFGDKPAFQFNAQKTDAQKTQFPTQTFGSQSTTSTPFSFGGNDKPSSFGSTFHASNQPLNFNNKSETKTEPFKFGSTVSPSNAFQFSANKTSTSPVQFGQTANTFPSPGFGGFGNSTPQTTFGNVQSPQPSPFGNIVSSGSAPTFGNATSPTSNTFGTSQGFQFGSTNNVPTNTPSTFAFGGSSQPVKPDGAFSFNAAPANNPSFQFGQASSGSSTSQIGGTQSQGGFGGFGSPPLSTPGMQGSNQALFSMGAAPPATVERRKAKAVRRRQ